MNTEKVFPLGTEVFAIKTDGPAHVVFKGKVVAYTVYGNGQRLVYRIEHGGGVLTFSSWVYRTEEEALDNASQAGASWHIMYVLDKPYEAFKGGIRV